MTFALLGCASGALDQNLLAGPSQPADGAMDAGGADVAFDDVAGFDTNVVDVGPRDGAVAKDSGISDTSSSDVSDAGTFDARDAAMDVALDVNVPDVSVPPECAPGETQSCTASCGSGGLQRCFRGNWTGCLPPAETCNMVDDDCDGVIDNGIATDLYAAVSTSALNAAYSSYTTLATRLDWSMSAASRWCKNRDSACYVGGIGSLGANAGQARVMCLPSVAEIRRPTIGAVQVALGFNIPGDDYSSRLAQTASHRYCRTQGFEAGAGPLEWSVSADYFEVACFNGNDASAESFPKSTFSSVGCDVANSPESLTCSEAAFRACTGRGFRAGYGPVEWNLSNVTAVCLN